MDTLKFYAERVVERMRKDSITAKAAVSKVCKVRFTRKQRNKLFELVKDLTSEKPKVRTDADKNAFRQERSLGANF